MSFAEYSFEDLNCESKTREESSNLKGYIVQENVLCYIFFYNRRFFNMFIFYREKLNKGRIWKYIGKVSQHAGWDGTILNNEGYFSNRGMGTSYSEVVG